MNVILAIEIYVVYGVGLTCTIIGAQLNSTPPAVFLLALGSLALALYTVMLIVCVAQIWRHRQPEIPVLTKAARWIAYGNTEGP